MVKNEKMLSRAGWWRMGLRLSLVGVLSATLALGSTFATPSPVQAAEWRVSDPCNGCTHTSIQAAIDAASSGDIIKVAQGTYKEKLLISSKAITLQGGYSPPNWTTPSTNPSLTVINAAGQNDSAIRLLGCPDPGATIENFTITGGAGHNYPHRRGGGIEIWSATVTIRNNIIQGNEADEGGGICIYDQVSSPRNSQILNNTITSNIAIRDNGLGWGGGVALNYTNATLKNNTISNNTAHWGGGFLMWHSNPTIEGNIIKGNSAVGSSDSIGGAFFIEEAVPIIRNNVIANNIAQRRADGIYIKRLDPDHPGTQAQIVNNTIVANKYSESNLHEGICIREYISPIIRNNIIALNGCGIRAFDGTVSPVLSNNDVWGNIVNYASLSPGPGDISADPQITSDYHLQTGSPCIDTGTSSNAPPTDFEGDPRPTDGDCSGGAQYDIGADEYGLWIANTASSSSPDPGDIITYTITYRNDSASTATWVITDILSTDLLTPTFTSSGAAITPRSGVTYAWQVDNLAPCSGGIITITAQISPSLITPTVIPNMAEFYAAGVGSFNDDAPIIVGGLETYLPLIFKNY